MRNKLAITVLALFMLGICTGLASAQGNSQSDLNNAEKQKRSLRAAVQFKDMENEWSREAVMQANIQGFVNGYEDGLFRPNQPLTHLEAIAMLLNAKVGTLEEPTDANKDILSKIPEWGQIYVAAALEEGIITFEELKAFNPNQGIKRYEVCIYMARIDNEDLIVPSDQQFKDWTEIPEQHRELVQEMFDKGIIKGDPDHNFAPNRVLNRCEMAVMLGRLDDKILHGFEDSKVKGALAAISALDRIGDYTITVDTGDKNVDVNATRDTMVFVDGNKVEDLDKLAEIQVDSQVNIFIKDGKAVFVKITTQTAEA